MHVESEKNESKKMCFLHGVRKVVTSRITQSAQRAISQFQCVKRLLYALFLVCKVKSVRKVTSLRTIFEIARKVATKTHLTMKSLFACCVMRS